MAITPRPPRPRDLRFRRLLSHGYFPSELPPPFTTSTFSLNAENFASAWNLENISSKFWSVPEAYNIPRYEFSRRKLSIVNPVNQLVVSRLIAYRWRSIKRRLRRSRTTEFRPDILLTGDSRAVSKVDFERVARRRAEILARYGRYIKTDIAQFYASVYTHSIGWALLGKAACKAQARTLSYKTSFANLLDKAVASGQEGQTSGIPIGPDTSRIISELIVSEVEEIAKQQVGDWTNRAVRFVDDMLIGVTETESVPDLLANISAALYEYELELSAAKTKTVGLGASHSPEWTHYLSSFSVSSGRDKQRADLDSFFEQALFLQDNNPRNSVMLFAIKRAVSFSVHGSNAAHLVRWMLYSARRSPNCLGYVAEHLAAASQNPGHASDEIRAYILQQIPIKAVASHTNELAWLLFWALEIGLVVPSAILLNVVRLRSSVVGLLTLDLMRRGNIQGNIDVSFWQSFCSAEGLKSEMWLVAYEATKKGWWPTRVPNGFIRGHQYFKDLLARDVEFYDVNRRARVRTSFQAPSQSILATLEGEGDYW